MPVIALPRIRFEFKERKAAAAAAFLLERAGGRMPYFKLIKLLYLCDRESLIEHGRPITGDTFVAMPHGCALSEVYALAIERGESKGPWREAITRSGRYHLKLVGEKADLSPLSDGEVAILERAADYFHSVSQWRIADMMHDSRLFPEWRDPERSSFEIDLEELLELNGKSLEEIEEIRQASKEHRYFDRLFGT